MIAVDPCTGDLTMLKLEAPVFSPNLFCTERRHDLCSCGCCPCCMGPHRENTVRVPCGCFGCRTPGCACHVPLAPWEGAA